jgi:hypothetical protein
MGLHGLLRDGFILSYDFKQRFDPNGAELSYRTVQFSGLLRSLSEKLCSAVIRPGTLPNIQTRNAQQLATADRYTAKPCRHGPPSVLRVLTST